MQAMRLHGNYFIWFNFFNEVVKCQQTYDSGCIGSNCPNAVRKCQNECLVHKDPSSRMLAESSMDADRLRGLSLSSANTKSFVDLKHGCKFRSGRSPEMNGGVDMTSAFGLASHTQMVNDGASA